MTTPREDAIAAAAEALSRKIDWFLDRNIYRAYPFEDEARTLRAALAAEADRGTFVQGIRDPKATARSIADAALDAAREAAESRPDPKHGPHGNEGYCYCGVFVGHDGDWSSHRADPTPEPEPVSGPPRDDAIAAQTAAEYWEGRCGSCAHPEHPVRACHEYVLSGDPSNGPEYCPCAQELEAMDQALAALSTATPEPPLDVDRLTALVKSRWLATVEWDGNGSRAEWRCAVCGKYNRHADDACPVDFILAALRESQPAPADPTADRLYRTPLVDTFHPVSSFVSAAVASHPDLSWPGEIDRIIEDAEDFEAELLALDTRVDLDNPKTAEALARVRGEQEYGAYWPERDDAWAAAILAAMRETGR